MLSLKIRYQFHYITGNSLSLLCYHLKPIINCVILLLIHFFIVLLLEIYNQFRYITRNSLSLSCYHLKFIINIILLLGIHFHSAFIIMSFLWIFSHSQFIVNHIYFYEFIFRWNSVLISLHHHFVAITHWKCKTNASITVLLSHDLMICCVTTKW